MTSLQAQLLDALARAVTIAEKIDRGQLTEASAVQVAKVRAALGAAEVHWARTARKTGEAA